MRFCNHCGKPVSEGNPFCDYCGAELRAGSNTVPGGSPFRPAADFDTQSAPTSQPGDNGFSAPGNIGAPEGSFHKLRLPSQWSQPSTASEARVPANRTFSDLKFGRNSQHSPDPAPAKKKSPVKRIIAAVLVIVILAGFSSYFAMEKLRQDNSSGTVKNAEEAIAYMAEMSDTYGYQNAASELTEKNTSTIDGDTYYRLQQNYHGIPVYGRTAVYVTDEAGKQIAVTGNLCDVDESISLTPTITQEEAENSIIDYISEDFDNTNILDITISKITDDSLCIYNMSDCHVAVLAYIVNVSISYGEQGTLAYECTVDSRDASVLKLICTTLSENVLLPAIQDSEGDETSIEVSEVNVDGTKYYELVDEERRIKIYSANKHLLEYEVYWDGMLCLNSNDSDCYNNFYDSLSTDQKYKFGKENWSNVTTKLYSNPWYSNRVEITEPERIPVSKGAEGFNKNAFFLMTNLQTTYDVYYLLLGLEGIGSDKLWINGVYNDSFGLGFGNSDNAYCWQWGNLAMLMPDIVITFGTDCHYTLDTVAHEYAHGIEKCRSNMAYECESGAIMEALSDIFGEIIEDIYYQRNGIGHANWRHSSYRNIQSPEDSRQPAVYNGKYYKSAKGSTFMNDHGYVHNNSTVISHAAYLMWNGINGTEEKKLSTEELAKLWYRAMLMMPSDCNFATCRTLVELAAQSMGLSDKKRECVAEAFDTVGIPANEVPCYKVSNSVKLSVFDFNQELCESYSITAVRHILSSDSNDLDLLRQKKITEKEIHYLFHVNKGEPFALNLPYGFYTVTINAGKNSGESMRFNLMVTTDGKDSLVLYTDFGLKAFYTVVVDAYIEACHFYGSWFYSGYANSGWLTESQKYVETYENGNVSVDNFDDYYNKHCRARDHEITTVAQLKDRLYNYFLPDFADTLLENADPIESEGKLFTYAPGPFVPMCTGVEKLESIEKTGEHTWLLTVSGHTQWDENEPIYGRVLCEYKDGKCLFSTYDEENRDYLIGNSVFDLIAELSLPSENAHNNQDIPSDAVQFNGHYYYLYDFTGLAPAEKNTWENALAYCQGVNGYLATITSPEENEFVYNYMKKRGYASAYFGLTDNGTEGTWTWCNGEALNYTNWASGEPNGGTGENYALFYYKYSDGTWNDGDFVDRATRSGEGPAFICEWGEYEVGGQETTEPINPPGAPESGGNATGMSYEEARSIYLDYFRNIDLESLRVPFSPYTDETVQVFDFAHCSKEDYTIQSMLADIGNDGSYELLLIVGNPKFMGPAGYPICSLLFAIHDGKVEQVLDSYFTGGTAGGGTLSVVFDTVTERHLVATNSHGRDGIWYGLSTFTVFDCRDQSFAEAGMLTSAAISLDSQYYQSKADQIRAADPYTLEENGYLKYFLLDDVYISKSEYEAQRKRYTEPTDASFILKDATFENLIP